MIDVILVAMIQSVDELEHDVFHRRLVHLATLLVVVDVVVEMTVRHDVHDEEQMRLVLVRLVKGDDARVAGHPGLDFGFGSLVVDG